MARVEVLRQKSPMAAPFRAPATGRYCFAAQIRNAGLMAGV